MSIIKGLREYLLTCPCFENLPMTVDFLPAACNEAAIEPVPIAKAIKEYTDGSKVCSYQFIITVRFPWYADENNGILSSEWFEALASWLENSSEKGELPKMPEGMSPIRVEATPNRFGFDGKNSLARYQLICNLIFLKEKREDD